MISFALLRMKRGILVWEYVMKNWAVAYRWPGGKVIRIEPVYAATAEDAEQLKLMAENPGRYQEQPAEIIHVEELTWSLQANKIPWQWPRLMHIVLGAWRREQSGEPIAGYDRMVLAVAAYKAGRAPALAGQYLTNQVAEDLKDSRR